MEIEKARQELEDLLVLFENAEKNSADNIIFSTFNFLRSAHAEAQCLLLEGRFGETQRCLDLCKAAFVDTIFSHVLSNTCPREDCRRLARLPETVSGKKEEEAEVVGAAAPGGIVAEIEEKPPSITPSGGSNITGEEREMKWKGIEDGGDVSKGEEKMGGEVEKRVREGQGDGMKVEIRRPSKESWDVSGGGGKGSASPNRFLPFSRAENVPGENGKGSTAENSRGAEMREMGKAEEALCLSLGSADRFSSSTQPPPCQSSAGMMMSSSPPFIPPLASSGNTLSSSCGGGGGTLEREGKRKDGTPLQMTNRHGRSKNNNSSASSSSKSTTTSTTSSSCRRTPLRSATSDAHRTKTTERRRRLERHPPPPPHDSDRGGHSTPSTGGTKSNSWRRGRGANERGAAESTLKKNRSKNKSSSAHGEKKVRFVRTFGRKKQKTTTPSINADKKTNLNSGREYEQRKSFKQKKKKNELPSLPLQQHKGRGRRTSSTTSSSSISSTLSPAGTSTHGLLSRSTSTATSSTMKRRRSASSSRTPAAIDRVATGTMCRTESMAYASHHAASASSTLMNSGGLGETDGLLPYSSEIVLASNNPSKSHSLPPPPFPLQGGMNHQQWVDGTYSWIDNGRQPSELGGGEGGEVGERIPRTSSPIMGISPPPSAALPTSSAAGNSNSRSVDHPRIQHSSFSSSPLLDGGSSSPLSHPASRLHFSVEDIVMLEKMQERTIVLQHQLDIAQSIRPGRNTQYYIKRMQIFQQEQKQQQQDGTGEGERRRGRGTAFSSSPVSLSSLPLRAALFGIITTSSPTTRRKGSSPHCSHCSPPPPLHVARGGGMLSSRTRSISPPERGVCLGRRTGVKPHRALRALPPLVTSSAPFFPAAPPSTDDSEAEMMEKKNKGPSLSLYSVGEEEMTVEGEDAKNVREFYEKCRPLGLMDDHWYREMEDQVLKRKVQKSRKTMNEVLQLLDTSALPRTAWRRMEEQKRKKEEEEAEEIYFGAAPTPLYLQQVNPNLQLFSSEDEDGDEEGVVEEGHWGAPLLSHARPPTKGRRSRNTTAITAMAQGRGDGGMAPMARNPSHRLRAASTTTVEDDDKKRRIDKGDGRGCGGIGCPLLLLPDGKEKEHVDRPYRDLPCNFTVYEDGGAKSGMKDSMEAEEQQQRNRKEEKENNPHHRSNDDDEEEEEERKMVLVGFFHNPKRRSQDREWTRQVRRRRCERKECTGGGGSGGESRTSRTTTKPEITSSTKSKSNSSIIHLDTRDDEDSHENENNIVTDNDKEEKHRRNHHHRHHHRDAPAAATSLFVLSESSSSPSFLAHKSSSPPHDLNHPPLPLISPSHLSHPQRTSSYNPSRLNRVKKEIKTERGRRPIPFIAPLFVPLPHIELPDRRKHIYGIHRRSLTESYSLFRAHRSPSTGLIPYREDSSTTSSSRSLMDHSRMKKEMIVEVDPTTNTNRGSGGVPRRDDGPTPDRGHQYFHLPVDSSSSASAASPLVEDGFALCAARGWRRRKNGVGGRGGGGKEGASHATPHAYLPSSARFPFSPSSSATRSVAEGQKEIQCSTGDGAVDHSNIEPSGPSVVHSAFLSAGGPPVSLLRCTSSLFPTYKVIFERKARGKGEKDELGECEGERLLAWSRHSSFRSRSSRRGRSASSSMMESSSDITRSSCSSSSCSSSYFYNSSCSSSSSSDGVDCENVVAGSDPNSNHHQMRKKEKSKRKERFPSLLAASFCFDERRKSTLEVDPKTTAAQVGQPSLATLSLLEEDEGELAMRIATRSLSCLQSVEDRLRRVSLLLVSPLNTFRQNTHGETTSPMTTARLPPFTLPTASLPFPTPLPSEDDEAMAVENEVVGEKEKEGGGGGGRGGSTPTSVALPPLPPPWHAPSPSSINPVAVPTTTMALARRPPPPPHSTPPVGEDKVQQLDLSDPLPPSAPRIPSAPYYCPFFQRMKEEVEQRKNLQEPFSVPLPPPSSCSPSSATLPPFPSSVSKPAASPPPLGPRPPTDGAEPHLPSSSPLPPPLRSSSAASSSSSTSFITSFYHNWMQERLLSGVASPPPQQAAERADADDGNGGTGGGRVIETGSGIHARSYLLPSSLPHCKEEEEVNEDVIRKDCFELIKRNEIERQAKGEGQSGKRWSIDPDACSCYFPAANSSNVSITPLLKGAGEEQQEQEEWQEKQQEALHWLSMATRGKEFSKTCLQNFYNSYYPPEEIFSRSGHVIYPHQVLENIFFRKAKEGKKKHSRSTQGEKEGREDGSLKKKKKGKEQRECIKEMLEGVVTEDGTRFLSLALPQGKGFCEERKDSDGTRDKEGGKERNYGKMTMKVVRDYLDTPLSCSPSFGNDSTWSSSTSMSEGNELVMERKKSKTGRGRREE